MNSLCVCAFDVCFLTYSKITPSRYACAAPGFHQGALAARLNRLQKLGGMLAPFRGCSRRMLTKRFFDETSFDKLIASGVVPLVSTQMRFNTSCARIEPLLDRLWRPLHGQYIQAAPDWASTRCGALAQLFGLHYSSEERKLAFRCRKSIRSNAVKQSRWQDSCHHLKGTRLLTLAGDVTNIWRRKDYFSFCLLIYTGWRKVASLNWLTL